MCCKIRSQVLPKTAAGRRCLSLANLCLTLTNGSHLRSTATRRTMRLHVVYNYNGEGVVDFNEGLYVYAQQDALIML